MAAKAALFTHMKQIVYAFRIVLTAFSAPLGTIKRNWLALKLLLVLTSQTSLSVSGIAQTFQVLAL